ncbi:ROK family transcriptional regulator [Microlunatus sp. Y2014]|uniref:ROK family transcriptional regulator n=1 Tax=Microlunatus sp. Y2014 TaxID=3418488 RepID=UPI003DA6E4DD
MTTRADRRSPATPAEPTVMRQHSLRSANLGLVLRAVLTGDSPSRADVAARTGMTRSTVSRLVDELMAGGLLAELEPLTGARGRPATPLVAAAGTVAALGLELSVEHVFAHVSDLAGNVLAEGHRLGDFAHMRPAASLAVVADLANECIYALSPEARVAGVHLAIPGLVDVPGRQVLRAPNLGWTGVAPVPLLAEAGLAVERQHFALGNEADCAALALALEAPGRPGKHSAFLYVSGEVGVGSAVVSNGELVTGQHGWAGEIGHLCVDPHGLVCACGATGCLETVAGLAHILAAARLDTTEQLLVALADGDRVAREAVDRAGRALGIAVSGAMNLLDLPEVVLGGHLAAMADRIVPLLREEMTVRVLSAPYAETAISVDVDPATRPAVGAAYAGLDVVLTDPGRWLEESRAAS